jgi:lipid A 4'-phosphatase
MHAKQTSSGMRVPRLYIDLLIVIGFLLFATVLIRFFDLDIAASSPFYHPGKSGWYLDGETNAWINAIYDFGTWPAIVCAIGAVGVFVAGFKFERCRRWRKLAVYLVLALILGPGLVVNAALKDHWGRPRPRQIEEFGGREKFEPVLSFDPSSEGKSFPCGHCSMGFYFLAIALFLRRIRSRWWIAATLLAIALGVALGFARIAQGGHFLSDIIWSAGFCYVTFFALFYALRLHLDPFYEPTIVTTAATVPRWAMLLSVVVVVIGLGVFSIATPYRETFRHVGDSGLIKNSDRIEIVLNLAGTNVEIRTGNNFAVSGEADGFGLPGSAIKEKWKESLGETGEYAGELKQRRSGFFSELEADFLIEIPAAKPAFVKVITEDAGVTIDLTDLSASVLQKWKLQSKGSGRVVITLPPGGTVDVSNFPPDTTFIDSAGKADFMRLGSRAVQRGAGQPVLEMDLEGTEPTISIEFR